MKSSTALSLVPWLPRYGFATRLVIHTAMLFGSLSAVHAQSSPAEFYNQQTIDLVKALHDPTLNDRVREIWIRLAAYSKRQFPVIPAQNNTAGMALPSGVILLDVSIAGNESEEVTAFFLAHEWAHQSLNHPRDLFSMGAMGPYVAAIASKSHEDEADRWAAKFLKKYDYDLQPVLEFLRSIPVVRGDTHSTGTQRARNVQAVYGGSDQASRDTTGKSSSSPTSRNVDIEGDWSGMLQTPTGQLSFVLHLSEDNGRFTATADSPFQNAYGIPVSAVSFTQKVLRFKIPRLGVTYQGRYTDEEISGTFNQGGYPMNLTLTRN